MGVFKLGKMTFGSLFKKPETVLYPLEKKPQPIGLKGHIVNEVENCILCGICEKGCPTDCLSVDKAARTWSVMPFQCIQCGYCVQVCPKNCLKMDPNYWSASTSKDLNTFTVPEKETAKADNAEGNEKLEAKLASMDPEKAEKVRAAMAAKAAKAANTENAKPVEAAPETAVSSAPTEQIPVVAPDHELEAKLALLDGDKAKIVRAALANR